VRLPVCVALITLCPIAGKADLAGDWAGLLTFPQGPLHFVLHMTGPDNALKATHDSPDQNGYGMPVSSIAFSGTTLKFDIKLLDLTYSGDLSANGSIVGTFVQHGTAVPLVLTRAAAVPRPIPTSTGETGYVQDGRYHHNPTGVEFDLPAGWSVGRPAPAQGDPNTMTVLRDPDHKALFLSADMRTAETHPENIPAVLSNALTMLVARRAGQTGAGAPHLVANYKIRPGSEERTTIGGQQALRAIGEYDRRGMKVTELLTWIDTEHTRVFFFAQIPSENIPALQTALAQIIQSARIS
jgi:hypothetical protein